MNNGRTTRGSLVFGLSEYKVHVRCIQSKIPKEKLNNYLKDKIKDMNRLTNTNGLYKGIWLVSKYSMPFRTRIS